MLLKLQDVVEGLDLDRNLGHLLGGVINLDIALEHGSNEGLVVVLSEAVGELSGAGKLYVVVIRVLGNEAQSLDLAAEVCPLVGRDRSQNGLNGGSKTLHCGSNGHAVAVFAVDDAGLVNVNADDLCAFDLCCCFSCGCIDTAAAGKDDLGAALVPCIHNSSDCRVREQTCCRKRT